MQTNSTTNTTTDNKATSASGDAINAAMGGAGGVSDMFTKLLVAQIKNQNPLEPTDPSQFVSQLTQLSQMEALQKLADQNASSASMLASLQMLALGAQVGANLSVQTDRLTLAQAPVALGFNLESNSAKTTLVLTGSDGREKRIELGSRNTGAQAYTLDPAQLGLTPGSYTARVETSTKETPALEVTGTLTSVQLAGGSAVLNVTGAGQVAPTAITRFNSSNSQASATSH